MSFHADFTAFIASPHSLCQEEEGGLGKLTL